MSGVRAPEDGAAVLNLLRELEDPTCNTFSWKQFDNYSDVIAVYNASLNRAILDQDPGVLFEMASVMKDKVDAIVLSDRVKEWPFLFNDPTLSERMINLYEPEDQDIDIFRLRNAYHLLRHYLFVNDPDSYDFSEDVFSDIRKQTVRHLLSDHLKFLSDPKRIGIFRDSVQDPFAGLMFDMTQKMSLVFSGRDKIPAEYGTNAHDTLLFYTDIFNNLWDLADENTKVFVATKTLDTPCVNFTFCDYLFFGDGERSLECLTIFPEEDLGEIRTRMPFLDAMLQKQDILKTIEPELASKPKKIKSQL